MTGSEDLVAVEELVGVVLLDGLALVYCHRFLGYLLLVLEVYWEDRR